MVHYRPLISPNCGSGVLGIRVKCPCCSMAGARHATTGNAWTWRYRNISSDLHRPSNRIRSVSMLVQSKAMAPEERSDLMEMSKGEIPKCGPRMVTVWRSAVVSVVEDKLDQVLW
jgi:hypothetical protein